jgi:O-antigen/teichoic acid export membrane protein
MQPDERVTHQVVGDAERKRLLPNAAFSVAQVLVSAFSLLFLYRVVISQLGPDGLGVWTILMAATSLGNLSSLGISGGLVRFVSIHLAGKDATRVVASIETSLLTLAGVVGVFGLLLYGPISWGLQWLVTSNWLPVAQTVLPYALLSLWLGTLSAAVNSALDGCHRADRRAVAVSLSQLIMVGLALTLTPLYGLKGLAISQVAQYVIAIIISWIFVRKCVPALPAIPYRWRSQAFTEMWRYGLGFQLSTVLMLLSDVLAKGMLSHFTSLSTVGYFEMANRLVVQARAVLVAANQVATPYFATLQIVSPDKVGEACRANVGPIALIGSLMFAVIASLGPIISVAWVGHLEVEFVYFLAALSIGWFASSLAIPAFYANIGISNLRANIRGNIAMLSAIVGISVALGPHAKPYGAALAYPVGLIVSGYFVNIGFADRINMRRSSLLDAMDSARVAATLSLALVAAFAGVHAIADSANSRYLLPMVVGIVSFGLMIAINRRAVFSLVNTVERARTSTRSSS